MKTGTIILICVLCVTGCTSTGGVAPAPAEGRASAPSPSSGKNLDVSGTWSLEVDTDAGAGYPTFTFKQEGEKLTGHYSGQLGEAPVTGTVKGNEIAFSFNVSAAGSDVTIVYSGTVEQNSMEGKVQVGEIGAGTFTGKRE